MAIAINIGAFIAGTIVGFIFAALLSARRDKFDE
jgi:hypothetical protein